MDSKEIDEVIDALYQPQGRGYGTLIKYADMELPMEDIDVFYRANAEMMKKRIIEKIEKGDFEHFLKRMVERVKPNEWNYCVELLCYSNNVELIKSVVDRSSELNLHGRAVSLIEATHDIDYMKSIVDDKEKIKMLEINARSLVYLINATNDLDYIKEKVKDIDDLGIKGYDVVELMRKVNDPALICKVINDSERLQLNYFDIACIVEHLNYESKLESLKMAGMNNARGYILNSITQNSDELEKMINDNETRRSLHLNICETAVLFEGVYEPEKIKKIIDNKQRSKENQLEDNEVLALLLLLDQPEYVKEVIEKREDLGLSEEILGDLVLLTKDKEMLDNFLNSEKNYNVKDTAKDINLPANMTIGIEIESEGDKSVLIMYTNSLGDWICESDASLNQGVEVKSPILTGDMKKNTSEIKQVCSELNYFGQTVSENCGGHIHIGSDYLTKDESWSNLIEIWGNTEEVLYIISNKAGEAPRGGVPSFAKPISSDFEEMLNSGTVSLRRYRRLKKIC